MQVIKITILSENTTYKRGVLAEHGLSYLIENKDEKYIFDTGQNGIVLNNAKALGISLTNLNAIILSHGHYDHTGGLIDLISEGLPVFGHPDIFIKRYSLHSDNTIHDISIPFSRELIESKGANIKLSREQIEIGKEIKIFTTGEVPRINDFEKVSDKFFKDKELREIDPIDDDQSLYIETKKGLVVLLGCCHSGIINTLNYIKKLTGNKKINWIIGGTHLISANKSRLEKTIESLRGFDFDFISPLHCTGPIAKNMLMNEFKNRFVNLSCGDSIPV